MIYDGRVYADNTILKSTASCSMQMVLRHVLHWNNVETAAPLRAGNAAHLSLAEWPWSGRQVANSVYGREYAQFSQENVASDDRLSYENTSTVLDEWMTTRQGKLPWVVPDPRLIEVGFAYPLDESGSRVFFGRMDAIARDARTGDWVVVDHKTTGRIDISWVESWGLDSQLTGYYWAALQHVPNLRGFYVNGIEFSKLPQSDRKCPTHGLPYHECSRAHLKAEIVGPVTRTPAQLEKWRGDAIRLADKYRYYAEAYDPEVVGTMPNLSAVEMEGPFTNACRFCQFRDWCRTGQSEAMLPGLYVQDEWRPYDPREFETSPAEIIT